MQGRSKRETLNGCDFNSHHLSVDQLEPAEANEDDYIRCSRCDQQVVGQMYHCPSCSYYVHSKCIDLQETIVNHPLHPHQAALALSLVDFDSNCHCYGCPKKFRRSFLGYKCTECPRKLDVKCALSDLDNNCNIHDHALEFYYVNEQQQACNRKVHGDEKVNVLIDEVTGKRCTVCELPLIGPVSGCEACNFWIHKGCQNNFPREIPPSIDHHCHLRADHSLIFFPIPPSLNRCGACGTAVLRNTLRCDACRFDFHFGCASRKASLRHELIGDIHNHDLTFFPDPAPSFLCSSCKGFSYKTPIFRCVRCDFSLHKACLQFPSTVRHKNHPCSLHLFEDFPIYIKIVCSVCGEDVSPNPGAYCCSDCNFFVHIECVSLQLEADHQEKTTKVLGKVVRTEQLVGSTLEDSGRSIYNKMDKLQGQIKSTMADLTTEKKILKQSEQLKDLLQDEN